MRALVVDDSSAIRGVLRVMLKQFGFDVIEAEHGNRAVEVLGDIGPLELALVDWNMPEMGGLDLVRQLRSDHRFDTMQIMMVTTETDMSGIARALGCGANEYVMKPFNQQIIEDKLRLLGLLGS
ncbi:MAG TPA: response regulator [Terriglobales bacterium]|nr:response regulator [Terriglobales bacterium]